MKIKRIYFGSSIEVNKSQQTQLHAQRDKVDMVFDRGIFFIMPQKVLPGGEPVVCVASTNVKSWVPMEDHEHVEPVTVKVTQEQAEKLSQAIENQPPGKIEVAQPPASPAEIHEAMPEPVQAISESASAIQVKTKKR